MFAIIKTGGKQYTVETGRTLKVDKVKGKKGDVFTCDQVLLIENDSKHTLGTPYIKGASVKGTIINQIRDKKIVVFKKRRRKNYRSTQGHRQFLTIVKIDKILTSTSKIVEKNKKVSEENKKEIKKKNPEKLIKTKKKAIPAKTIKKKTVLKKTAKKKTTKDK